MKVTPTPTSPKSRSEHKTDDDIQAYYGTIERPARSHLSPIALAVIALVFGLVGGFVGQLVVNAYITEPDVDTSPITRNDSLGPEESFETFVRVLDERVRPAVLRIYASDAAEQGHSSFLGDAVALTADGLLLTTDDVVADETRTYEAVGLDGRVYDLQSFRHDDVTGAVFGKVEARGLTVIDFAPQDDLTSGMPLALVQDDGRMNGGYVSLRIVDPFQPVSAGVAETSEQLNRALRIAPTGIAGTPGAPLVDEQGRLVALWGTDDSHLIASFVASVVDHVISASQVRRPSLDVQYLDLAWVADTIPSQYEAQRGALLIDTDTRSAVVDGTSAAKAGLTAGDIITHIGTVPLDHRHSLSTVLQTSPPDDVVSLTVLRGGESLDVVVSLDSGPTASDANVEETPEDE